MGKAVLSVVALFLCLSLCIFGQGTTSRLTGTVTDTTGSAVAEANVTLTNEATGATFATTTSSVGTYTFEALVSGNYSLTVEAKGFRRFVSKSNPVTIGQPTTVNATLEVGGVTETVEVIASAEAVQTSTSGNFGNLLSENVIRDMPIVGTRGRNPLELVLLQPGVVSGSNTGRPFTAYSGFNTFNNGVSSTINCNNCDTRSFGNIHDEAGLVWWFTPEERAKMSQPGAGELGNTGRNAFAGPTSFNLDTSLIKRISFTERVGMELRADVTNLTNTPTFGFPTTTFSSTIYGRIRDTVSSFSRKVQLGAKINF